jgi:hypothetical protein
VRLRTGIIERIEGSLCSAMYGNRLKKKIKHLLNNSEVILISFP